MSSAGLRRGYLETAPGEQRRVVHRELRSIRRISRERLQNLPQSFPTDDAPPRIFPRNLVKLMEIVMKNVIKTQSGLAKFMVAAGFFGLGCTAIGGTALAQQPTAAA